MKNFNYLCLSLVLVLFACTKEVGMEDVQKDTIVNDVEALTDADRALYSLTTMLDDVAPQTRMTSGQTIKAQTLINVSDIIAEEYSDVAGYDNAFYLVTLENENGVASTAFLGATPNLPSVIAIINGVEYTIEDCCEACAEIFGYEYIAADDTITRSSPGTGTPGLIVPPIVPPITTIIGTPTVPWNPGTPSDPDTPEDPTPTTPPILDEDITTTIEYGWANTYQVMPLMKSHFHQDWPFNDKYAYMNDGSGKKYYAGCVIIAVAQILAYNKLEKDFGPTRIGNTNIDWENIRSAIDVQDSCYMAKRLDISSTSGIYTQAEVDALSSLCKSIADIIQPTYSTNGTYATLNKAKELLRICGYYNLERINYDINTIHEMIVTNGLPMYITGDDGQYSGHAWTIDGWYQRDCIKIITKTIGTYVYSQETCVINTEKYVHYNWGWKLGLDGYYAEGVFDTANAFIRTSPNKSTSMSIDYCEGVHLINYSIN